MTLIQLLLILGAIAALFIYLTKFRSVLLDRVIALGLFLLAMIAILVPEITNQIAHYVGVWRGADLVMYLFIVATVFALLMLYTKLSRLADNHTKLVRAIAIEHAERP